MNNLFVKLYGSRRKIIRQLVLWFLKRSDEGELLSLTLRTIMQKYHDVQIGLYTHGGCFIPGAFARYTKIGRYCSIAKGVLAFNRNHPAEFKSTHAIFFNSSLGFCDEDKIEYTPLTIGNDVWLGSGVKILANVKKIGDGAIIGAGAVLNRDIPPYGIALGNPARLIGYRFEKDIINELVESKWWEKSINELIPEISEYQRPYKVVTDDNKKMT